MSSLSIVLNQNQVESGKQISGTVYIDTKSPNETAEMSFQGVEYVRFTYSKGTNGGRGTEEREQIISDQSFLLGKNLAVGYYSFPFSCIIPSDAPASSSIQCGSINCWVKYFFIVNLGSKEVEQEVIVTKKTNPKIGNQKNQTPAKKTNLICCVRCCECDKGTIVINAVFEKPSYSSGGIIKGIGSVDASNSRWDVSNLRGVASLNLGLIGRGRDRNFRIICGTFYAGKIPKGEKRENIPIEFQLDSDKMALTTHGSIISAEYTLDLEAEMDGCCNFTPEERPRFYQTITVIQPKQENVVELKPFVGNMKPKIMERATFSLKMNEEFYKGIVEANEARKGILVPISQIQVFKEKNLNYGSQKLGMITPASVHV